MNFGKPEIFHSGDKFRGYVVERLLGNGSLGAVYLVRHELLDTVYALKALFPDVAKENSDCPSKARGGDLGAFGHGQMVPEFDKAAFEQPVGEIGEIVKTQFGYHIVKVTEKIPAHVPTLEDFREDIVESIRAEAVMKAQREYIEGLRDAAKLEFVRETVVSEPIAVPAPPSAEEKPAAEAAE